MAKTQQKTAPARELVWGGDYKVAMADLPEATIYALAQRGFTHVLGNEVASAVKVQKDKGEMGDAELAVFAHDKRIAKINDMIAGALGVSQSGPRATGIDKVIRDISVEEIKTQLVALNAKLPKTQAKSMPTGKALTALVDKYVEKHGDRLRKAAEIRMAEVAKATTDADELLGMFDEPEGQAEAA